VAEVKSLDQPHPVKGWSYDNTSTAVSKKLTILTPDDDDDDDDDISQTM
jgi:hypothetical protein